jgi:hypothetical protein
MKVPAGLGTPLTGPGPGRSGLPTTLPTNPVEARQECADVAALTTQIVVRGSVRRHRVRFRIWAATAFPALARLELVGSSRPPLFIFTARSDDATLLAPRDNRVLQHERASVVLEAVTGIPLNGVDIEGLLTGCPRINGTYRAFQFGDTWLKFFIGDNDEVYLRRNDPSGPWHLVVMIRRVPGQALRWRAEFLDRRDGVPRSIRLTSLDLIGQPSDAFDIQLSLRQVEINPLLGPEEFAVPVPQSAQPLTLDELRRSGPLGTARR